MDTDSANRMKAIIVASRTYAPEGNAAAYRLGALVRALDDAGYSTTVLTSQPPGRIASTSRVRRWPVLRDRGGAVRGYLQYASFDIPLFFRLLFRRRADCVIVEPPPTTGIVTRIACSIKRTPYIYFSADVTTSAAKGIGTNRFIVACIRVAESWVLRGATAVLAISEDVKHEIIGLGAKDDSVAVIGTGIDTDQFSADGPSAEVDYPYLIYAGTMSELQGAGVFIEAFGLIASAHPTARLKMFGQGVELAKLKARARAIGDNRIDFPGLVSAFELAPWLRGAYAGLASARPAKGYDFAFTTKALVTISCGTPVIYSGVGSMYSLIEENRLGWSVGWDAVQVAQAMDAALHSTRADAARQNRAQWIIQNYSLKAVAARATIEVGSRLD